jgi:hypothetical protein
MSAAKTIHLLTLALTSPRECRDRVATILDGRTERGMVRTGLYQPRDSERTYEAIEGFCGRPVRGYTDEPALHEVEEHVRGSLPAIQSSGAFGLAHNADLLLARCCYALCRAFQPGVVVETGVAYGVTSAFLLQALEVNGAGELYSIDLPPLGFGGHKSVGALVPERHRPKWHLMLGSSHRLLPLLLCRVGKVGLFIHDSLHTYRNMRSEFETVRPHLSENAVLVADDIEGNVAFYEWTKRPEVAFWSATKEAEKQSLFGVSIMGPGGRVSHP